MAGGKRIDGVTVRSLLVDLRPLSRVKSLRATISRYRDVSLAADQMYTFSDFVPDTDLNQDLPYEQVKTRQRLAYELCYATPGVERCEWVGEEGWEDCFEVILSQGRPVADVMARLLEHLSDLSESSVVSEAKIQG
jgi:hypothetical protein